jgi:hypothetical protein
MNNAALVQAGTLLIFNYYDEMFKEKNDALPVVCVID